MKMSFLVYNYDVSQKNLILLFFFTIFIRITLQISFLFDIYYVNNFFFFSEKKRKKRKVLNYILSKKKIKEF